MRKLFVIFIFVFFAFASFSQTDTTVVAQKIDSLSTLADSLSNEKKYSEALSLYAEIAEVIKNAKGENCEEYITNIDNIAMVYFYMFDYQNSLKCFIQEAELIKKLYGEEHPDYIVSLNNIVYIYYQMGDSKSALKYSKQALEVERKTLGEDNSDYATSLHNIGIVYNNLGDYQNALKYCTKAFEIRKKILGEEHPDYTVSLNGIGFIYSHLGDYQNALKYYKRALELRKKILGEEHPSYATTLNNIGSVYLHLGEYQNALKYYNMALEIRKKILGEDHSDYATVLSNIGNVYSLLGDYQNALKYSRQALEIDRKTLGEEHPYYAVSLSVVGDVYSRLGDTQNALKYNSQALEINRKNMGEEHPLYATSLNNIGCLYWDTGDYQSALKYHIQALEIRKKALGEKHPDYAKSLNNVGATYLYMGDYNNALKYFNSAIEIREKTLGENHPSCATSLGNASQAYYGILNYHEAININKQATDIRKKNLISNFSFMTAHEREAYWNANNQYFSNNIKYTYKLPNDTLATKTSYNTELITKGLLLASEISMTNIIMESGDSVLISDYENMKTMHLQLNKELEKPIEERVYNCDSLENEIQKKERLIMEKSKEFGDVTHFIKIDWKEVQNSLKNNDVAIEFSNFTENDTTRYLALVLTKSMEAPVCVPLFNQFEMQKLQRGIAPAKTETSTDDENRGATTVAAKRQGIYESTGLYNLLWKPLEKYFPENPRIYFAPSGMLHQIAVEYAPISKEQTISDKYEIYRVSSTRFLAMDYMPKPMKNSVLYGGIYYDSDTTTMKQESDRYSTRSATYSSFADFNRNEDRGSLNYLPGTKTEVENIEGKMKKKKVTTSLYEGSQANEESFKALSGSDISVLHIATHGFFLPTDEKLFGDQSLVQSGLLLSGANYAWQNQQIPEGIEDGILTAKEISFMDLRKTDLVVLSACQTALGEITGEGVFGLQRGFKKAGVRTIIMSLWPVDDNATLLMMTEFYTNITKGMSKREAFLAAQNKVKTTPGFENPRYWAAFIMLDGNEN
ncbi:MAG: CHAT domain-containing protein [Bacteroidales bacterium]|nr:CHAT domain-containing protein [Bacteroidales bacterium]